MNRHSHVLLLTAIPAAFILANPRRDGASYHIVPETVDSGGGRITSANYSVTASVGQTAVGSSTSTNYNAGHGYIAQFDDPSGVCPLFDAWRLGHFGSATSAAGAPAADPDVDGADNAAEFAFNLNPLTADAATVIPGSGVRGLPFQSTQLVVGRSRLTLEFIRPKSCGTLTIEGSADLTGWTAIAAIPIGSPVSVAPDYERVKVADTVVTTSTNRRFLRLRVGLP